MAAKYWERTKVYPNRYLGRLHADPEGKKVLKLPNGAMYPVAPGKRPAIQNYSVVVTTVATNHLKAQELQDPRTKCFRRGYGQGSRLSRGVNLDGVPDPLVKIAHNPGNKLSTKRHADFAYGRRGLEAAFDRINSGKNAGWGGIDLTPPRFLAIVKRFRKNASVRVS